VSGAGAADVDAGHSAFPVRPCEVSTRGSVDATGRERAVSDVFANAAPNGEPIIAAAPGESGPPIEGVDSETPRPIGRPTNST
jgi:hypothetical protein